MTKGICMLLVLYCHTAAKFNGLCIWASSFFISCFVICSGMTSQGTDINLKKNCKSILIPYYIWGAFGVLTDTLIRILQHTFSMRILLNNIWKYLLGIEMWNYPLWFLLAFFVGKIVYQIIQKYFGEKGHFIAETIVVFVCAGIGIWLAEIRVSFYVFRLDTGLVFVMFFWIGRYLKRLMGKMYLSKRSFQILFCLGAISISCVTTFSNSIVSMSSSDYGNIALFILSSIFGSVFVLALCMVLEKLEIVSSFLSWWGINSNFVMCCHVFAIYVVAVALRLVGKLNINKFMLCVTLVWIMKKGYDLCCINLVRFRDLLEKQR